MSQRGPRARRAAQTLSDASQTHPTASHTQTPVGAYISPDKAAAAAEKTVVGPPEPAPAAAPSTAAGSASPGAPSVAAGHDQQKAKYVEPSFAGVSSSAPLAAEEAALSFPMDPTPSTPRVRALGAGQPRSSDYVSDTSWAASLSGAWYIVIPLVTQHQEQQQRQQQQNSGATAAEADGVIDWTTVQSACEGYTVRQSTSYGIARSSMWSMLF